MNLLNASLQATVLIFHARGCSSRRIARELQIDHGTVARYIRAAAKTAIATAGSGADAAANPAIATLGSEAGEEAKPARTTAGSAAGRVSLCREFEPIITTAITAGLSAQRIHRDLVSALGFTGSYQSVKRCVRRLATRLELPVCRLECGPGKEVQIDFGQGAWIISMRRRANAAGRICFARC